MGCSTSSLMWTTTTGRSSGWSQTPETSWASLGMAGCPSSRNGQRPRLPWSTTGRAAERGRALLERLVDRARENGISRFVAFIRSDNRRAVELMSHLGPPTSSLQGDLVELDIELPKQGIGAPLATALREPQAPCWRFNRSRGRSGGGPERCRARLAYADPDLSDSACRSRRRAAASVCGLLVI